MSQLRKEGVVVRQSMSEVGIPAISAAPEVWAGVEKAAFAAVAGDPVAREHVLAGPPMPLQRRSRRCCA